MLNQKVKTPYKKIKMPIEKFKTPINVFKNTLIGVFLLNGNIISLYQ